VITDNELILVIPVIATRGIMAAEYTNTIDTTAAYRDRRGGHCTVCSLRVLRPLYLLSS